MKKDHKSVVSLPDTPGVYFFLGKNDEVLYVGKATSLKDRVRSYFSNVVKTRGSHVANMVRKAKKVDIKKTDSVLEALILESNLIRECKPRYNMREKDDKSFNYLVITIGENYPRLLTVRGKDLTRRLGELRMETKRFGNGTKEPLVFGPFPHAVQFREALKLVRKIFPFYDTNLPVSVLHAKDDNAFRFYESIGVYPSRSMTAKEYGRTVRYIQTLFEGKQKKLYRMLEKDMRDFAKAEEFEKAGQVKRQLFALKHIEDVSLLRKEGKHAGNIEYRIEAYDVAHLGGTDAVGAMVVFDGGELQKNEYRTFGIRNVRKGSDTHALREMLERRLEHPEWRYPRLIVVDGGKVQMRAARRVLEAAGILIPVVAVTKDRKHRQKKLEGPVVVKNEHYDNILLVNGEAHRFALAVHKRKRAKRMHG